MFQLKQTYSAKSGWPSD